MVGYDQNSFITSLDRFNDKKLMQTNPKGCAVQIFNNSALGLKKMFPSYEFDAISDPVFNITLKTWPEESRSK